MVIAFIIGVLVAGIALGVFNILSNTQVTIGNSTQPLVPQQLAQLGGATAMTLMQIVVIVALVMILVPVLVWLMRTLGSTGRGR
jgi:hypothetical protein